MRKNEESCDFTHTHTHAHAHVRAHTHTHCAQLYQFNNYCHRANYERQLVVLTWQGERKMERVRERKRETERERACVFFVFFLLGTTFQDLHLENWMGEEASGFPGK